MPKIVTANMLTTGAVVFLDQNGRWVETIDDARSFSDSDAAEEGLAVGQRDVERAILVDPFVTDKEVPANGKSGMTLRDSIRAFGPTIKFLPADTQHAAARDRSSTASRKG